MEAIFRSRCGIRILCFGKNLKASLEILNLVSRLVQFHGIGKVKIGLCLSSETSTLPFFTSLQLAM